MKKWSVGNPSSADAASLAAKCGLSPLCVSVLMSRGLDTIQKLTDFFGKAEDGGTAPLSSPFLIRDMKEAAEIIQSYADSGELICIYGDYDCDGITSTAILYSYLECIGANVTYYINMRSEGYGLCEDAVRQLAEKGVQLIVTVDNGISAINEARLVKELGMHLVITDHHHPGDVLPEAEAVVNPHRADCLSTYKDLCGCGVALKLIAAMDGGDYSSALEQFSDLAALATIADVVPLTGENREIVTIGLHYLENTENLGLMALMERAGVKKPVNSTAAAFSIVPRINASGRFGSASDAVEMLLADDPEKAASLAEKLDKLNSERKEAEAAVMEDIRKMITENPSLLYKKVIVLYGEGWHHGVIGIVAARLVEHFGKPVFLLSDDGDEARGSARSVEKFSVYEALSYCKDVLVKFGGHTGAGGFSLPKERVNEFDELLQKYAKESFEHMPFYTVHADKLIQPGELTEENVRSLSVLEPFGECNKQPLFLVKGARLDEVTALSQGAHTKLKLSYGGQTFSGLMFGKKTAEFPFKSGDSLDLLVYPSLNSFGGRTSVDLRIQDCRLTGVAQAKYFNAFEAYESWKRGEGIPPALAARIIPTRDELVQIYRILQKSGTISGDVLFMQLDSNVISYCKLRISLDIFAELGFITYDIFTDKAEIIKNAPKAAIESSKIYQSLLNKQ
jgi:single-stranded-DNA-specific exonuclease